MNTKTTPSFIKRLDQYLLKNFPVTWSSRIHAASIYGLGFALLLAIISFIVPNDPRNESIIHYWITLVSIISLLALIFWLIYLLRFNVFKRYGAWKSIDTLKTFILYFIITFIIISWAFIPPVVESIRANAAYTSDELVKDVNDMNIKICQLERDSIDRRFQNDTFLVTNKVKGQLKRYVAPPVSDTLIDDNYVIARDDFYYIDTAELRSKLLYADSVKKLSDSLYVIYKCPVYTFVYDYRLDEHSQQKLLSSMDLYRSVLQFKQDINKEKTRRELDELFSKYNRYHQPLRSTITDYTADNYYGDNAYSARIKDKYNLYDVNRRLTNIWEKMYRWGKEDIESSFRIAYYISLILSMLVLIYRHTTRRTFFLSLLTAVILSILTSLFIAMMPYSRANHAFFNWVIAYFIIFLILSVFVYTSRTRHVIPGIALNLLVFMTPFMPLIFTGMYYRRLRDKYDYELDPDREEYYRLFKNEELHALLAEIGGFVLLIVLLATLYRMAYKKWFSSPEQ